MFEPGFPLDVQIDNESAIVAVHGSGGLIVPELSKDQIIEADAIALDRKTGSAVRGYVSVYGKDELPEHGTCRLMP
jgi:hypothetical protein